MLQDTRSDTLMAPALQPDPPYPFLTFSQHIADNRKAYGSKELNQAIEGVADPKASLVGEDDGLSMEEKAKHGKFQTL